MVLLVLHVLMMAVTVLLRPARTVIETAFAALAYAATVINLLSAALNLLEPGSVAIEALVAATVVAQLVLLCCRFAYQAVFALFIAGQLRGAVPESHTFSWPASTRATMETVKDLDDDSDLELEPPLQEVEEVEAELREQKEASNEKAQQDTDDDDSR